MNQGQSGMFSPPPMTVGDAYTKALELLRLGQLEDAKSVCMSIVAVRPNQPDVYKILGAIAYKNRDHAGAIKHFRHALKLGPDDLDNHRNIAKTYRDMERWDMVVKVFEDILARMPNDDGALYDLGMAYVRVDRFPDAIDCFKRALAITPDHVAMETELASALLRHGNVAEAERHYNAVLARKPEYMAASINLSLLRDVQGRMDDALGALDTALRYEPDNVDARVQRALGLLARGRFTEGWAEYPWRFQSPKIPTLHNIFSAPYWNGEPLQDRKLLVWIEQGVGDEILIASLLPDVLAQGAQCTLVCTTRLVPIFQRAFPDVAILTRDAVKKDPSLGDGVDFQASLSHLGIHLRPSFDAFPNRRSYLRADPQSVSEFRARYTKGSSDRVVGIAWHSANRDAGMEKSSSLNDWAEILRTPGYRFVSLQYGDHGEAYKALRKSTGIELTVDKSVDSLKDLDRFTAQVAAMDLVISVSNTSVHVAGALGVPVWTLVPASYGRIWYWFLEREDSPWYPSMRLFRQERGETWAPTIAAVARQLRDWT